MHRFLLIAFAVLVVPASIVRAQGVDELWSRNCANCHGKKGEGGGAGTRTLLTRDLMKAELDRPFFDAIKNGVEERAMPAFGVTMTAPQMWGMVVFIREMQHRAYREAGGSPKESGGIYETQHHRYKLETVVARGLTTPWAVDWLPGGEVIITERPGPVRVFADGKLSAAVAGTPAVVELGQGGMMDVAVHPDYAKNGWVLLAFTDPAPEGKRGGMTKVVKGKLTREGEGWRWGEQSTLFEAKPEDYSNSAIHFGCKIAFDPNDSNIVYFTIGERGQGRDAQLLTKPNGKVHRVTMDGRIPKDNPFVGQAEVDESIWSYGHRNPQGLVFDLTGNLWDTEHGPRGGDELNLVKKGGNYGWPLVAFSIDYSGMPLWTPWPEMEPAVKDKKITMPVLRWLPSIAACGLDVVRGGPKGEAFPKWKGDLLAGGLAGETVDRVRVRVNPDGTSTVVEEEEIFFGKGRVRDVVTGPDGSIYIVLNGPDKIVRLAPPSNQ